MFSATMKDPLYQGKRTFKTDSEGAPWTSLYAAIRFSIFQFLAISREPGIQLRGKKCQAASQVSSGMGDSWMSLGRRERSSDAFGWLCHQKSSLHHECIIRRSKHIIIIIITITIIIIIIIIIIVTGGLWQRAIWT